MGYIDAEANVGRNMRSRREARGISQEVLADEMQRRGFKWHQATVYSAERGDRRIQLNEAHAIAEILDLDFHYLQSDPERTDLHLARRAVLEAHQQLAAAAATLFVRLDELMAITAPIRDRVDDITWLAQPYLATADDAVGDGWTAFLLEQQNNVAAQASSQIGPAVDELASAVEEQRRWLVERSRGGEHPEAP